MAGTTVSTALNVGIVLSSPAQSPVLITEHGSVFASGNYDLAIYGNWNVAPSVTNAGLLFGGGYGMTLRGGGSVVNGSESRTAASISGGYDGIAAGARAPLSVTNFGTIASTNPSSGNGIDVVGNVSLVNGSLADRAALVSGYFDGVFAGGAATVRNFATILAGPIFSAPASPSVGVYARTGGTIVNGGWQDATALISAVAFGVEIAHAPGSVTNFGRIEGTGAQGRGVSLLAGGTVSNMLTNASIIGAGRNGIYCGGTVSSSVQNFGTVQGGKNGVSLQNGGTVFNGSAGSTGATIIGARQGVYIEAVAPSFVANSGTIRSTGGFWGVSIYLGGLVANGGTANAAALITGGGGIYQGARGQVVNYGTIQATTRPGVMLKAGGILTNAGRIASNTGTAVYFGNGPSLLRLAPGATFGGVVSGGSATNTLELLPGRAVGQTGSLSALGGWITNFTQLAVDPGANWVASGSNTVATMVDNGTITISSRLVVSGVLGGGTAGAALALASGAVLDVASAAAAAPSIVFPHGATLLVEHGRSFGAGAGSSAYAGPLLRHFGPGDAVALRDMALQGFVALEFDRASGRLDAIQGGTLVQSLRFDTASLGPGSFHLGNDGSGHVLLTHS